MNKTHWIFLAGILFIGVLLRVVFLFSTDLSWDEAFHILLAFKLGSLFLAFPIVLLGLIVAMLLFSYFVLFRQNVLAAILFSLVPLAMVFVFGLPITIHPAHPPFFNILEGLLLALTGLGNPEVIGKLISFASSIVLAFSGFFLAKHLSGVKAGLIVFALFLFSPFSVLYSTTAYNVMLGDSLAFLALAVFIIGMEKNSRLIPLSGFFFALAFFTRFTTLMFLLPVIVLLVLNRKKVFARENISKYAIFGIIILLITISLLPAMLGGFDLFSNWGQINTTDIHIKDLPHYSAFLAEAFGEHPVKAGLFFFVKEMFAFYSIVLPLVFLVAVIVLLSKKKRVPIIFILLFLAYFVFYSLSYESFQDINFFLEIEIPMLFVVGLFLGGIKSDATQKMAVSMLLILFLFQSVFIIFEHDFKGLSETVSKIPSDKTIMTSYIDPVKYYTGQYLFDNKINNRAFLFLGEVFGVPEQKEYFNRVVAYIDYLDGSEIQEDYIILTEPISENDFNLSGFVKCFDSDYKGFTVFTAYAKTPELCEVIKND